MISHCVIEDMHGQKAPDFEPGVTAYGLYASGVQTLTVDDCVNEPPRGKPRGIRRLTTA
jgi:hypothetical protein